LLPTASMPLPSAQRHPDVTETPASALAGIAARPA
jgi:hypothetical protein